MSYKKKDPVVECTAVIAHIYSEEQFVYYHKGTLFFIITEHIFLKVQNKSVFEFYIISLIYDPIVNFQANNHS